MEEKVHGRCKLRIHWGEGDDRQIASYTQHIGDKQEDKYQSLKLWVISQSQQNECHQPCMVSHHGLRTSAQSV